MRFKVLSLALALGAVSIGAPPGRSQLLLRPSVVAPKSSAKAAPKAAVAKTAPVRRARRARRAARPVRRRVTRATAYRPRRFRGTTSTLTSAVRPVAHVPAAKKPGATSPVRVVETPAKTAAHAAPVAVVPVKSVPVSSPVHIRVNGSPVFYRGAGPVEVQGEVLAPLWGTLERIGVTIAWNRAHRTATIQRDSHRMSLTLGSTAATVDGNPLTLKAPAQAVRGKIMVPIEPVAKAMGAGVNWDAGARTVEISPGIPASGNASTAASATTNPVPAKPNPEAVAQKPAAVNPKPATANASHAAAGAATTAAVKSNSSPAKAAAKSAAPKSFLQDYKDPKKEADDLPMSKVLIDLFLKLLVVLGIAWLAIFILSKFKGTNGTLAGRKGHMKVLESVTLGPNRSVHLVRVGEKVLVIGSTPEQVNAIGEIDDPVLRHELLQERGSLGFNSQFADAMQRGDDPTTLAGNVQGGARHILDRVQEIRGLGDGKDTKK